MRTRRQVASLIFLLAVIIGGAANRAQEPASVVYSCPMHPDVRGKAGDVCPRCGMTLVVAGTPDYAPYRLEITSLKPPTVGNQTRIQFVVRSPRTGAIVDAFETVHERILHLFVISNDLKDFAHIHPTLRADGSFEQVLSLPRAGAYRLIADFVPVGSLPQLLQKTIVTAGFTGSVSPPGGQAPDLSDKIVGGVRVRLSMEPAQSAQEQILVFDFEDAKTGAPVDDLEPYLAATGHLLTVSSDLDSARHSHPFAPLSTTLGPRIAFQVLFPRAGIYKLWVQFQRRGRVLTASFTVPASDAVRQ